MASEIFGFARKVKGNTEMQETGFGSIYDHALRRNSFRLDFWGFWFLARVP